MKFIRRLKALIRKLKAERKLKKSGYDSWRRYRHNRDPDINRYANHIEYFYEGYPYLVAFKDYSHYAYTCIHDFGIGGLRFGYNDMADWCEDHIRWNYRCDCHRVWQNQSGELEFNDIGGGDIIFFAFKREKDYTHFMLRWS